MKKHATSNYLFCIVGIVIFLPSILFSQGNTTYPKNYFRSPLDIPLVLAGNFGECRPNHFHTGLDFKTNEKENLPVSAVGEGYVSRVSISHSGYGNAIYVTHPNGYTSVYGHLNDAFPALQQYIVAQQYQQEKWNIDIQLEPSLFPIQKGALLAYSGNTGGSTGPHLHFEIRDTKTEHVLNAGLFGFNITDNKSPIAKSIALYTEQSIYEQNPTLINVAAQGNKYTTTSTVVWPYNKVRIAVKADDFMNSSTNTLGIYSMQLFMDGQLQSGWELADINFEENRYMNAFADYKLKEQGKSWYQTLFKTKNNNLSNYTYLNAEKGTLDISDAQPHEIIIKMNDVWGNSSQIQFSIQGTKQQAKDITLHSNYWNALNQQQIETPTLRFMTYNTSFYDDVLLRYSEQKNSQYLSNIVQLFDHSIPLHSYSPLAIKLNKLIPFNLTSKLVFVHKIKAANLPGNNPQNAAPARYEHGWAVADIRTLGQYYVMLDTVPPVITPIQKNNNYTQAKAIKFSITDNYTSVKNFKALLNGQWIRFVRSGNTYTYIFDERCPKGQHTLTLIAADESDNEKQLNYTFTR
jgi:hypothetical protein